MANKTISMEIVKQIKLLSSLGLGKKTIARQLSISKNTVKEYLSKEKNAEYIDITPVMKSKNGKIDDSLYLPDMLHMKPEGYKKWASVIQNYLL